MKTDEIKKLFSILKMANSHWQRGGSQTKDRIEKAIEPTMVKLEALGVARHFSEALLFFGMEFLEAEYGNSTMRKEATISDAEAIFGAKAQEMTEDEKKAAKLAEKEGALIYQQLPKKDGKVGIKVLSKISA